MYQNVIHNSTNIAMLAFTPDSIMILHIGVICEFAIDIGLLALHVYTL